MDVNVLPSINKRSLLYFTLPGFFWVVKKKQGFFWVAKERTKGFFWVC